MGAWGTGVFEDDTSCDLLYEVMEGDAKTFVKNAAEHIDSDDLEYDEGQAIIVAGSILDSILNGQKYSHAVDGYDEWLAKQDKSGLAELTGEIIAGLKLVLSNKSELKELWEENEDDYPVWKKGIKNIITNLSKHKK